MITVELRAAGTLTCLMLLWALAVAADARPTQPEPAVASAHGSRPKIGLVLSGGGARGAAHAGVIKVLDELRIPVDYIAGTSMGAIAGGLYASGMEADELVKVFETVKWAVLLGDRPARARRSFRRKSDDVGFLVNFDLGVSESGLVFPQGLVQGQKFELELRRLTLPVIAIDNFDELPIPFRAVATDILTGEGVILGNGDLATAMRASMSAPGIFRPIRLNGQVLVDGGIANNLPVQVVRDMGADILIVVDVGFPLLPEEELQSAFSVTLQVLTILINARAEQQIELMTDRDVLLRPDLGDMGSEQFNRLGEALALGEKKGRELAEQLAALALPEADYLAHREHLRNAMRSAPIIDRIVVENDSKLSPRVLASRLHVQEGETLDLDVLESDIADIYGFDTFQTVTYQVIEREDATELMIRGVEKSWGPNYLRFGVNLEDNFDGESSYNLATRYTRTEINRLGGEFRGEVQIGSTPRLFAEFYQPLDYGSRWFVNPSIEYQRSTQTLFSGKRQLAKFGANEIGVTLAGGRQLGNWGELRVGISRSRSDGSLKIGDPTLGSSTLDIGSLSAALAYDTIDRIAVPRSGTNLALAWSGSRRSIGSDATFDVSQVFLLKPQTWGNHTILHWWDLAATTGDKTGGIAPFDLGGLFSLSGYAPGELSGVYRGIGRLLYYYRLGNETLPLFDTPVYVGASLEAGNAWQSRSDIDLDNTLMAGSLFVVFDSLIGPLYLAYGDGENGRRSVYLFLGQTF